MKEAPAAREKSCRSRRRTPAPRALAAFLVVAKKIGFADFVTIANAAGLVLNEKRSAWTKPARSQRGASVR